MVFAIVVNGRAVQTNVQTISPTKYSFLIENAISAKEFTLFLTDIVNFPIGFNAAIYLAWTPFTDWKYLGYINSVKPSIICGIPNQTLDTINNNIIPTNNENSMMNDTINNGSDIGKDIIQIGISIETDLEIQSKPPPIDIIRQQVQEQPQSLKTSLPPSTTTITKQNILESQEFKGIAFKLCDNLVNYILSFSSGPNNNMVPTSAINKWYENFQKKLQNNSVDFLK